MKNWKGGLVAMLIAGTASGGAVRVAAPVHMLGVKVQKNCSTGYGCREELEQPSVSVAGPQTAAASTSQSWVPSQVRIVSPALDTFGAKAQEHCSTAYDFLRGCREAHNHPPVPAPASQPAAASTPQAWVSSPVSTVAPPVEEHDAKFYEELAKCPRDRQFGFFPVCPAALGASSYTIPGRPNLAGAAPAQQAWAQSPIRIAEPAPSRQAWAPSPNRIAEEARHSRGGNVQKDCANEIGLFCSGKAAGDISACLQNHQNDVLPNCRAALQPSPTGVSAPTPVQATTNPQPSFPAAAPVTPAPTPVASGPDQGGPTDAANDWNDQKDSSEDQSEQRDSGKPASKDVRMNFDEVNAEAAPVAAESYLKQRGIEVEGLPANGDLYIVDYHSIYPDQLPVRPSSPPNVLYPMFKPSSQAKGGYVVWSYTLKFKEAYSCVRFTRPQLIAGSGITYPQWSAVAYDKAGNQVAVVSEQLRSSFSNVPAAPFELQGKDIASVHFSSDNHNFAAFGSVHVDDLELLTSCGK